MRTLIGTVSMSGVVVIGEGEKDDAPMLFNGEQVGDGTGPECDVAVDPIDGTTLMRQGHAQRDRGHGGRRARLDVRPVRRLLHGEAGHRPGGRRRRRHQRPGRARTSRAVAKAKGAARRGRHRLHPRPAAARASWSSEVREAGARIKFISDGDVAGAIMAAREGTGVDLLLGIGGTPEGIIAACAIKCLGGVDPGPSSGRRTTPSAQGPRRRPRPRPGAAPPTTWSRGDNVFFVATGITDGELLAACATAAGATTHSLVMRSKSGTIREIKSEHRLSKLGAYAAVDFG